MRSINLKWDQSTKSRWFYQDFQLSRNMNVSTELRIGRKTWILLSKENGKKLLKTELKWHDALPVIPVVLYSIHSTANLTTGLSPHEVLMGRPMSTGASAPLSTQSHSVMDWWMNGWVCETLSGILKNISFTGPRQAPRTIGGAHPLF